VRDLWPFVITGVATGSIYGIAAMGLVLTYKTSGIFNFSHGALAAASAYVFYELHVRHGQSWPLSLAVVLFVVGPLSGLLLELLTRRLAEVTPAMRIVATVGLLLVVQGLAQARYGTAALTFKQFLPERLYHVGGVTVSADQVIVTFLGAAAAAGLFVLFRFSRLGIAMRGVVDNPTLLDLAGTNPRRIRRASWMIGNSFAGLSGTLLAPKIGLDPILLTLLVVQAFGAAAVGGFTSLPLTYAGGLLVGVLGALSTKYVANIPSLTGVPPSLPFIILFVVLLCTPRGRLVDTAVRRSTGQRSALPRAAVWAGRAALLAALVVVPHVVSTRLPVYTAALINGLVFVSLRPLIRTSGQVSLAHAGFAAIGAASFSHLAHGLGLPWVLALVGAGLVAVPVGAFLAVPAIRLSGLYLALATFGFGILLERMVFGMGIMFGVSGIRTAPRPSIDLIDLTSDKGFYYVCLAVVVAATVAMGLVYRSRLGRLLEGLAESPVALTVNGANVNVSRVLVFCISAFLAGIAGALFAASTGHISGIGFNAFQSLTWVAVLMVAGRGQVSSVAIAAVLLSVAPSYIQSATYRDLQPVMFGALALWSATRRPGASLPAAAARLRSRLAGRLPVPAREAGGAEPEAFEPAPAGAVASVPAGEARR
jgi:branched-subunit amino acid ABC-type transport system permease component